MPSRCRLARCTRPAVWGLACWLSAGLSQVWAQESLAQEAAAQVVEAIQAPPGNAPPFALYLRLPGDRLYAGEPLGPLRSRSEIAGGAWPAGTSARPVSGVTVGLRYSLSDTHTLFADYTGARRLSADPAEPGYPAKLGMEWKPAKSTFGLEHGALGIHFDSGYRLMLRSRQGRPALYLRGQF